MNSSSTSPESYDKARRRAGARLGFQIHLAVYILVNILLIIINFAVTPGIKWFIWPLLGWGIGLVGHAAGVFVFPGLLENMTKRELEKIERDGE